MSIGIKITAVSGPSIARPEGSILLCSGVNSYLNVDRRDIDDLIRKLSIVRDLPVETFDGMIRSNECLVEKIS